MSAPALFPARNRFFGVLFALRGGFAGRLIAAYLHFRSCNVLRALFVVVAYTPNGFSSRHLVLCGAAVCWITAAGGDWRGASYDTRGGIKQETS
jgi:hypothetical protein